MFSSSDLWKDLGIIIQYQQAPPVCPECSLKISFPNETLGFREEMVDFRAGTGNSHDELVIADGKEPLRDS